MLFVCIAFAIIFFIAGIRPSISIGSANPEQISFADRIDGPVRLSVIATPDQAAAFADAVAATDTGDVTTPSADPDDLASADAVVFLVSDWTEIDNAPWQEALSRDYERVLGMSADSFALSSTTIAGSRPLQLTFYNVTHYADWTMTCYAELFMHGLTEPEEASFIPSADCPI
ncbi:MAG: hypothetical protein AAGF56_07305 [Pseudomonadota bacterium]